MTYYLTSCAVLGAMVTTVAGHARLINPPGRSTMWRYGFDTPRNSNDHQLSCGGFGVQYYQNNGKCGICGDPYGGDRPNEAGGKYATGTIAHVYNQRDVITVQVEMTVNHGGWFEFRICPNNDVNKRVTEQCLDRFLLQQLDGSTRFILPEGLGIVSVQLKLPLELTCSQCVLQWKWNTASNVRCDVYGCCRGCGPQEQFYGCSDIKITANNKPYKPPSYPQPKPTQQPHIGTGNVPVSTIAGSGEVPVSVVSSNLVPASFIPIAPAILPSGHVAVQGVDEKCIATNEFRAANPGSDNWCRRNCVNGYCPEQYCDDVCRQHVPLLPIENDCKAKLFWRQKYTNPAAADKWCAERCAFSLCPLDVCEKSCWSSA